MRDIIILTCAPSDRGAGVPLWLQARQSYLVCGKRGHREVATMAKRHAKKSAVEVNPKTDWLPKRVYKSELARLGAELVKAQYWVKQEGARIFVLFEGRDAAGKGGVIKRLVEPLNPRGVRLVALGKPSDVERTQWFFQRYVAHLPAAGEIVVFDRSWYNRAVVERVMGYCTDEEYWEFAASCPDFERMLVRSGITLVKYWLSVSDQEQERRFQERASDPLKRWKLSDVDIEARTKWNEFSRAKDIMFEHTDVPGARWYQVEGDDKRRARLNCPPPLAGDGPLHRRDTGGHQAGATPAPGRALRPPAA